MLHVYGIKNCDSVKKALNFFKDHRIEYRFHDFRAESLECQKIKYWLAHIELAKLFNTRSTTYRNLKLKECDLSDDDKAAWLCKEPMLIKRPVVEYDGKVRVGFDQTQYEGEFL